MQAWVEHQTATTEFLGVKVTLQILQMEPLYSPGVGYQPCGFPSEEDVGLII